MIANFIGGVVLGYAAGIWTLIIAAKFYSSGKKEKDDDE